MHVTRTAFASTVAVNVSLSQVNASYAVNVVFVTVVVCRGITTLAGDARVHDNRRSGPVSAASHASARDATSLTRCFRDFADISPLRASKPKTRPSRRLTFKCPSASSYVASIA